MVERLQQNQLDNRERTDSLIAEFMRLNTAFRREGLDFLNVKGFSLGTEYCANPALRSQFDLDFWCSEDAAVQCKALMRSLGYAMIAASPRTLEFQAGEAAYPSLRDFYKAGCKDRSRSICDLPPKCLRVSRENGLLGSFVFRRCRVSRPSSCTPCISPNICAANGHEPHGCWSSQRDPGP